MAHIIDDFRHEQEMEIADLDYFLDLLQGVETHHRDLDEKIVAFLDRNIEFVDPIELAALRLASYELLHRLDVPYRVVIDEAVALAKRFGADYGHSFVNGVLDKAAAQWRKAEYGVPAT